MRPQPTAAPQVAEGKAGHLMPSRLGEHWLAVTQEYDYECGDPTGPCRTVQLWIVNAATGVAQRVYRTPVAGYIGFVDWR
jgi:hypothetical protein